MFLIKLWFYTVTLFVAAMHAKKMHKTVGLSKFWQYHFQVLMVPAYAADIMFNAIFGTLMFCELPREWLFTDRAKRHKAQSTGWRKRLADFWCNRLNEFDPGHC